MGRQTGGRRRFSEENCPLIRRNSPEIGRYSKKAHPTSPEMYRLGLIDLCHPAFAKQTTSGRILVFIGCRCPATNLAKGTQRNDANTAVHDDKRSEQDGPNRPPHAPLQRPRVPFAPIPFIRPCLFRFGPAPEPEPARLSNKRRPIAARSLNRALPPQWRDTASRRTHSWETKCSSMPPTRKKPGLWWYTEIELKNLTLNPKTKSSCAGISISPR